MANQGDRIHDAIHDAISKFDFKRVSFDRNTGHRNTSERTENPATLLVRDDESSFESAVGNRRASRLRERTSWIWEADVVFDNQVSLEEFELMQTNNPILLPRTADLDQQVTIELEGTTPEHPAEHQSSSGTSATFRFMASLSRL